MTRLRLRVRFGDTARSVRNGHFGCRTSRHRAVSARRKGPHKTAQSQRTQPTFQEMTMKKTALAIFVLATLGLGTATLPGCGGGGARTNIEARRATTGQELQDLKKAYESGAITEKEYEKQRKKILDRK